MGYYRRFIKGDGVISKPLNQFAKKNNFHWDDKAKDAFETLKKAMTQAPILALPDFPKEFILETDACDTEIGVVLIQEGRPIAYMSQAFAPRHLSSSIYDKELLVM